MLKTLLSFPKRFLCVSDGFDGSGGSRRWKQPIIFHAISVRKAKSDVFIRLLRDSMLGGIDFMLEIFHKTATFERALISHNIIKTARICSLVVSSSVCGLIYTREKFVAFLKSFLCFFRFFFLNHVVKF